MRLEETTWLGERVKSLGSAVRYRITSGSTMSCLQVSTTGSTMGLGGTEDGSKLYSMPQVPGCSLSADHN